MLKTNSSPVPVAEYKLEGVDELAALKVVEFCYTSAISVSEENLTAIFVAATKLGCREIIDLCSEMLTSSLDISTCVHTHLTAASLGSLNLMTTAGRFLIENIDQVCVSETFLCLTSQEMLEFVASLLLLEVKDMQLLKFTTAWFDHVMEHREIIVLQFIEKFPALMHNLKKYLKLDLLSDKPQTVLTYSYGDGDICNQVSHSKANRHENTTHGQAHDVHSDFKSEHDQLMEASFDVCASCGECCDGQCQLSQYVQECSDSTDPKKRMMRKFTNQSVSSYRDCIPWLSACPPSSCSRLVNKCHLRIGIDTLCSRRSNLNSDTSINRHEPGLHYHQCQKYLQRCASKEALSLNKQNYGCITTMKHDPIIKQSATGNKVQTASETFQVRKHEMVHRLKKTNIKQQYDKLQRKDGHIMSWPENIDKQHPFPADCSDGQMSSLSHKRSVNSRSLETTTSSSIGNHYNLSENHSNRTGIHSDSNAIDSKHNFIDSPCSDMHSSIDNPIAEDVISNMCCQQEVFNSIACVNVKKLGHMETQVGKKKPHSSSLKEEMVSKSLVHDLSTAKLQNVTLSNTKIQLLKCAICRWAFKERSTLAKHRHTVHGFVQDILDDGNYSNPIDHVRTKQCKNEKIQNTDNITELNRVNYNFEMYVPDKSCGCTNNPSYVSGAGKDYTENNHSFVSTQGYYGEHTDPARLSLETSSVFRHKYASTHQNDLCPSKILVSKCKENRQLGSVGENTTSRDTRRSWIQSTDNPIDMSKGSISFPSDMSKTHHDPLDLSNCYLNHNHSTIAECNKERIHSKISIAEMSNVLSMKNNSEFVYNVSPGHGAPLTGCITGSLQLPSEFLLHDARGGERETTKTYLSPPESSNDIIKSCSENGNYSMSVKKRVTSRQNLLCGSCNRVFSYQTAWFNHTQTRCQPATTYQCRFCNQKFTCTRDLKVHVCPNGIDKPYTCPHCHHTFAKNIHLKRHLATHSGMKPYPCWICGKRFSRSDHLKRHTQSLHAGSRPHGCHICGKEFVRKYELSKHMAVHT